MDREATPALKVFREFRGFVERWGRKATPAVKDLKGIYVPRARPDLRGRPDQLDLREMPDPRALEAFPVPQGPPVQ